MEEKLVILIYEKNIKLNQILKEQLSILGIYQVHEAKDEKNLIEFFEILSIDLLILNLNDISENIKNSVESYNFKNKFINLLGYYNKDYPFINIEETEITLLQTPFKVTFLLKKIEKLLSRNLLPNFDIFLMKNLKFLPYEKVLINLNTKKKERLTEKENKLLLYFCTNKNIEITKNNLLGSIWGVSESVNTHTLETHIYRLKKKLQKLEPTSSYLLSNHNGLYSFRF